MLPDARLDVARDPPDRRRHHLSRRERRSPARCRSANCRCTPALDHGLLIGRSAVAAAAAGRALRPHPARCARRDAADADRPGPGQRPGGGAAVQRGAPAAADRGRAGGQGAAGRAPGDSVRAAAASANGRWPWSIPHGQMRQAVRRAAGHRRRPRPVPLLCQGPEADAGALRGGRVPGPERRADRPQSIVSTPAIVQSPGRRRDRSANETVNLAISRQAEAFPPAAHRRADHLKGRLEKPKLGVDFAKAGPAAGRRGGPGRVPVSRSPPSCRSSAPAGQGRRLRRAGRPGRSARRPGGAVAAERTHKPATVIAGRQCRRPIELDPCVAMREHGHGPPFDEVRVSLAKRTGRANARPTPPAVAGTGPAMPVASGTREGGSGFGEPGKVKARSGFLRTGPGFPLSVGGAKH